MGDAPVRANSAQTTDELVAALEIAGEDEVPQIRLIPTDVDRAKLKINHPGYDHKYANEDINCNLPFDRLQEMVDAGEIGSLAPNTVVLMGLQPNVSPLLQETIPAIVEQFKADGVEAALLVPS